MTGTRHAGIERVHGAQDFQRFFGTSQRRVQQRSLVGTMGSGAIARARIPCGWNHRLIILDLFVFDDDPVRQRAARSFVGADALHFVRWQHRLVVHAVIALGDVVHQQLQMFLRQFG